MKTVYSSLFATLLLATPAAVSADVLLLDAINQEPANTQAGLPRPTAGMNMDKVRARFGAPATEHAAIGEPPITRWDYADYSVFFEHQLVLRTVVHR